MNNIFGVKILECVQNLEKIVFDLTFSQPPFSFEQIIKRFVGAELKNNINIKMILKMPFEFDNIPML